jgi:hypothetical protein
MNRKRFGLSLVLLSVILSVSSISITGAIIGTSIKKSLPTIQVFALVSFIAGAILLFLSDHRARHSISMPDLESIVRRVNTQGFGSMVLDTSAIRAAREGGNNIREAIENFEGKIFIPKEVYAEIEHDAQLKSIVDSPEYAGKISISDFGERYSSGYEECRKIAIRYIERTSKVKIAKTLVDYFKQPEEMSEEDWEELREGLSSEYREDIKNIEESARKDAGMARRAASKRRIARAREVEPSQEDLLSAMERTYGVSPADVDVLSTAIFLSIIPAGGGAANNHSAILANDSHITEATRKLRSEHGNFEDRLGSFQLFPAAA